MLVLFAMLPTKLAFVDIETTGGRTSYDRIIEIGIVRVENGEITKTYSSLINPQTHLPPEIIRLTGITEGELSTAPTFREIASDILDILEDCTFVAHNVRFDYGFLKTEFKRLNQTFASKHFCTVRLSRALYPQERHHNLDSLIQRFNLSVANRHRAFDDAHAIYTFYKKAQQSFPDELFTNAIKTVLKKPYLPVQLSSNILDALPELPGVYLFYGSEGIPLYIGKSINIKERVLSHFSGDIHSPLEMKIAQQVESIETFTTAGELGALFLESKLIKEQLPLFNRKLRRKKELVALRNTRDEKGYPLVTMETLTQTPLSDLPTFLGFFNSRKQAKDYLAMLAKEHTLCEKLLGLEKTSGACFGYRLDKCKGACMGKEKILSYTLRFQEAFVGSKIRPWPFPRAVVIEEKNQLTNTTDYFMVDNWCFLGKTTLDENGNRRTEQEDYEFDLDTYKILRQYITNPKNLKKIKIMPELPETSLTEFAY